MTHTMGDTVLCAQLHCFSWFREKKRPGQQPLQSHESLHFTVPNVPVILQHRHHGVCGIMLQQVVTTQPEESRGDDCAYIVLVPCTSHPKSHIPKRAPLKLPIHDIMVPCKKRFVPMRQVSVFGDVIISIKARRVELFCCPNMSQGMFTQLACKCIFSNVDGHLLLLL